MKSKWILEKAIDLENLQSVSAEAGIHPLVIELLARRGLDTPEARREFLSEKPQLTYDPFLMKDMRAAAMKILETAAQKKRICVYGDYDADGICSVSLMMETLALLDADAFYYIPSRFEEGYGLNFSAVEKVRAQGAELLLTVDCGSVSYKEVARAKELGMDVIVTDHHNMGQTPADCLLLNPKQENCPYPDTSLCGCGVAFKLAQALAKLDHGGTGGASRIQKADLNRILDLVAIATVGDIVPLNGENRTLVKYGMKVLNRGSRPGLQQLAVDADLKIGEIKPENVAYIIVPHLNAAGRLASAKTGVSLLTGKTEAERRETSGRLVEYNRKRRRLQEETYLEIAASVEKMETLPPFLLLYSAAAHEGITGIVAGKIKDAYYRPTAIVTPCGDGCLKGTGRSIPGVDLYMLLAEAADLFLRFGGHEGACGFLLREENLPLLNQILTERAGRLQNEEPERFLPKLEIDGILRSEELTKDLIAQLEQMEPFGPSNPRPMFCLQNIIPEQVSFMGDRRQHLRFQANGLHCVMFRVTDATKVLVSSGSAIDLAGYPGMNRWRGREEVQFIVSELRGSDL